MDSSNKIKKNKIWINILVFLTCSFLLIFFGARPIAQKIKDTGVEIQKNKTDLEISQKRIASLPEVDGIKDLIKNKGGELDVIFNSSDDEKRLDLFRKIESLAEETGNKITLKVEETAQIKKKKTATPSSADEKENKKDEKKEETVKSSLKYDKYFTMFINLEGGYFNFINFLNKLENMDYYTNVVSLNISKSEIEEKNELTDTNSNQLGEIKKREILKSTIELLVYIKK